MKRMEYPRIGETVLSETLENGLCVCVVPKPGYCKRYAFFATRYGGMDTRFCLNGAWRDTPAGIAHYLEHKTFDTEDGNALQTLASNGAEPNAFTSYSMTAYFFDCTEHFEENLRILLSFVSVPYYTDESVEKERGIIAQEIRMTEDNPDWCIYHNLMQCLYAAHPAREAVAGTVESIQEITAETLYDCHRTFYAPSNMILCVVGDVDPEAVLTAAREVLPPERGADAARDYGGAEAPRPFRAEMREEMEVAREQFLAGFKCGGSDGGEALLREGLIGEIAYDVLLGASSALYLRLYDEGLINGSFDGGFDQIAGGAAYLSFGGECREPEKVVSAVIEEAARLAREGVDEELFEQTRRANYGASLRALSSFENIAVGLTDAYFRGYDSFRFPELYDSVSKADVEEFLRVNLTRDRCALSVLTPKGGGEA